MTSSYHVTNPFLAASIAEAGMTEDKVFKNLILKEFLKQNAYGLFPFATGFLGLGDPFSTLWALRLVTLAGLTDEYPEKIEKAMQGLRQGLPDLEKTHDFLGFLLYVLVMLRREEDSDLITYCANKLIKEQGWTDINQNLRQGGFVAYDLMFASELYPEGMPIAEQWLEKAFSLTEKEPTNIPESFINSQENLHIDVWVQGYLRALVAASLYLRLRRPNYTPASAIIAKSVRIENQHDGLANFYLATKNYLPALQRLEKYKPLLNEFWDRGNDNKFWESDNEAYSKSVFISRWMGKIGNDENPLEENPIAKNIVDAIFEELQNVGLIGRYAGDRNVPHSEHLWDNNEVYMRGCKYGIAIFEGMPEHNKVKCGTNHNVLVEAGFMWGKGADVLVLRDPNEYSVLPTDLNGIEQYTSVLNDYLDYMEEHNVVYSEVQINLALLNTLYINIEKLLIRFNQELEKRKALSLRFIVDLPWQFSSLSFENILEKHEALFELGVVGISMGGDEALARPHEFAKTFQRARLLGYKILCHAGETTSTKFAQKIVEELEPDRIGHGLSLFKWIINRKKRTVVDTCLTSNSKLGLVANLKEHPFSTWLNHDHVITTLSTDDPAIFDTTITDEYQIAEKTFENFNKYLDKKDVYFFEAAFDKEAISKVL
ncbi:MAG: hypothetical protein GY755_10760 [Chloroflexi bacterium]|nr:hypothetical protein [Chloroflexota bacterium]